MMTDSVPRGPGLFRMRTGDGLPLVTNIRRLAGTERQPGSGLVSAGMLLLGLLDAGLLYVVFAAQDRFIFAVKHQGPAAMIQALTLDIAMIIFSVLGLGLARRGLAAHSERACIVVCALASAFMNWTAANPASLRSVAVYVSAPVLLALTTDRTISVVRRHVLGMRDDGSVWARLGHGISRGLLWALRFAADGKGTARGVRQAILAATPLPGLDAPEIDPDALDGVRAQLVATREAMDTLSLSLAHRLGALRELTESVARRQTTLELDAAAGGNDKVYPSKKAHLLAMYRARGDYGRRETAGRAATELAGQTGLQASTARAYIYQELSRLDGQGKEEAQ